MKTFEDLKRRAQRLREDATLKFTRRIVSVKKLGWRYIIRKNRHGGYFVANDKTGGRVVVPSVREARALIERHYAKTPEGRYLASVNRVNIQRFLGDLAKPNEIMSPSPLSPGAKVTVRTGLPKSEFRRTDR